MAFELKTWKYAEQDIAHSLSHDMASKSLLGQRAGTQPRDVTVRYASRTPGCPRPKVGRATGLGTGRVEWFSVVKPQARSVLDSSGSMLAS